MKNRAAVVLGRMGAKARMKSLTAEQRSEQGRRAVEARWRRAKPPTAPQPTRWWGLLVFDDPNKPKALMWSTDRAEIIARSRREDLAETHKMIVDVEYDPTRFTLVREFKPDVAEQVKALNALAGAGGKQESES